MHSGEKHNAIARRLEEACITTGDKSMGAGAGGKVAGSRARSMARDKRREVATCFSEIWAYCFLSSRNRPRRPPTSRSTLSLLALALLALLVLLALALLAVLSFSSPSRGARILAIAVATAVHAGGTPSRLSLVICMRCTLAVHIRQGGQRHTSSRLGVPALRTEAGRSESAREISAVDSSAQQSSVASICGGSRPSLVFRRVRRRIKGAARKSASSSLEIHEPFRSKIAGPILAQGIPSAICTANACTRALQPRRAITNPSGAGREASRVRRHKIGVVREAASAAVKSDATCGSAVERAMTLACSSDEPALGTIALAAGGEQQVVSCLKRRASGVTARSAEASSAASAGKTVNE
eukprot:scaffold146299_cov39-Tisochrysis_lutea.AAC.5